MASTSNHTIAANLTTAIEHLGRALQSLEQASQASGCVRIAALCEGARDVLDSTVADEAVWRAGSPHDSHVTLWANEQVRRPDALAILAPSVAQVTEPQADAHVAARHQALIDQARGLGIRVARTWRTQTIEAAIRKHTANMPAPAPKPETPAPAPTLVMAATTAKTTTIDVPVDRADSIKRLASLSDADFRALMALIPTTKAAA